ncbi:MAG: PKD domain-containing protein [Kiritimatiellae bacterium]|nr:PKD domain-containing protein [Kiritimatiellia bacterium]
MIVKRGIVTLFAAAFALRVGAATVQVADFAELQSAVAGASDGDEIVLAAGTNSMTASLTFSVANVTMRGATGDRDDVVLDAGLGNRRLAVNATGVTLRDFTFARGTASNNDGTAVNIAKAGATLENIRVTGCLVTGGGGAFIYVNNNVAATIRNCVVDGNASDTRADSYGYNLGLWGSYRYGKPPAGIYVQGNGSVIDGCSITNNHYVGWYDGVSALGIVSLKQAAVTDSVVAYNSLHAVVPFTAAKPVAIRSDLASTTFSNCSVHHNAWWGARQDPALLVPYVVKGDASGIAAHDNGPLFAPSTPAVATLHVPADYATVEAALEAAEPYAEIVLAASASPYVLAADLNIQKPVTIRGETGDFHDVTVSGNAAKYDIRLWTDGAVLRDLTVTSCKVSYWYKMQSPVALFGGGRVENVRVTNNGASTGSSGISGIRNYNGQVIGCVIDGNRGRDSYANFGTNGNGPYWQHGKLALMDRCAVTNNTATEFYEGGAQYLFTGGLFVNGGIVRDTLVAKNRVSVKSTAAANSIAANRKALGVYLNGGVLENSSIIENTSTGTEQQNLAGVTRVSGTVTNTLIWGNCNNGGAQVVDWTGDATAFSHCASADVTGMADSVELASAPYQWENGLPMPLANTDILDTGADAPWMATATDLRGNPRIGGAHVDIGATEFVSTLTCTWEAEKYHDYGFISSSFEVGQVTGDTIGLRYFWDLDGDGTFEAEGPTQSVTFTAAGEHVVTLKVVNGAGGEATCSRTFSVTPWSDIYVAKGNGNAAAPYDSWETAAATIEDALRIAPDATWIHVAAGTYTPSEVLMLTNVVRLSGETGDWKDVVVDAQNKRRVAWIANPDAALENATLTRGYTGGYAAGVHIGGGALRNCRVTACRFHNLGGQIDGNSYSTVANIGGAIVGCLIDNNSGSFMYNGNSLTPTALGLCQTAGLTDSCVVTGNYVYVGANAFGIGTGNTGGGIHLIGGTVRNSLVAWNRVNQIHHKVADGRGRSFAGGLYASGGTIINNTFVGNSTTARDGLSVELTYGAVIASGDAVVENNLVADNHETTTEAEIGCVAQGSATFLHNCAKNAAGLPGEGNVEAAGEVYRVRGGVVESSASSPCHDAGRNEDWMAEATDLYGRPRLFGKRVDIGAAECQAGAGTVILLR